MSAPQWRGPTKICLLPPSQQQAWNSEVACRYLHFFHRPYTAGEFDSVCRWQLLLSVMLQEVDIIKKCQNKMKRLLEKVDIQLKYVALILRHSTLTAPCFRHCSIDNNVGKRAELQRAANVLLYTRSLYTEK